MRALRLLLVGLWAAGLPALADDPGRGEVARDWRTAHARLRPVTVAREPGEPAMELLGRVVAGYQGWFAAKGDGSGIGWRHYGGPAFGPDDCTFESWPDLSEMGEGEKHLTPLEMADGSPACLFSSYHPVTVARHFRWMRDYGIDGVMLQRFLSDLESPEQHDFLTGVMENVRRSADRDGRGWAVMYDLSGCKAERMVEQVKADWLRLSRQAKVTGDRTYWHHRGKPLVAVWGVGFRDRDYTIAQCGALVDFFHAEGCSVLLGTPYHWRALEGDATEDPALLDLLAKADIVSPWAVGRYRGLEVFKEEVPARLKADIGWCDRRGRDYLPVIFPGFSWRNLQRSRGREAPFDEIPRLDGSFLWAQAVAAKRAGARMIYVAMFDEIDEGTAIFKVANDPPREERGRRFLSYGDSPPDHYLWLTGKIGEMLRSPSPPGDAMPSR